MLTIQACAKINLGLSVLDRRSDGYHNIKTYMQTINLADTVILEKSGAVSLTCDDPALPCGEDNLARKALRSLESNTGRALPINVHLKKRIPMQAGLGGGSADAAAVLAGVNRLYELGLDEQQLHNIAADVGADVPFLLKGGLCLCEGIGERLTPVDSSEFPGYALLLIKPDFSISTKEAYEAMDSAEVKQKPDFEKLLYGLAKGDSNALQAGVVNEFEAYAASYFPVIDEVKQAMLDTGALCASMSGSGSVIFGMYRKGMEKTAETKLRQQWSSIWRAEPIDRALLYLS